MLMPLFKLNSPYPLNESFKDRTVKCALFGLFVFIFLFVFKPFEMGELKNDLLKVTIGYGAVCFSIMFLFNVVIFNSAPYYFNEAQWNIKRELIWSLINILGIGSANFLYSYFIEITTLNIDSLLLFLAYTLAVGFFPLTISVIIKYARWNSKYESESNALNPFIESELIISAPSEKEKVKIVAENGALELEISPDDFLFAKSDDNYVELYYFINLQKNRKVIRNTLKNIQALFPLQNKFYRCHKSYLINLDQVNHISGNAQGYKFHLKNTEDLIPVSRSNNQFVKNYFTNRPKNTQIASKSV